jgi:hypothetical protein
MSNALYTNWTETQQWVFSVQALSSNAASTAFGTALCHHYITEWIMKGRVKQTRSTAPTFVVPLFMFWIVWTLCFNVIAESSSLTLYITTPVIAFGGFLINLTFNYCWEHVTDYLAGSEHDAAVNDSLDKTRISPLLDETDTTQEVDIETPIAVNPVPQDNDDTEQPVNLSQTYHQTSYRRRPSSFEVTTTATTAEQKPPKVTVDYINNIKIFLTNIVIIHHCYSSGQGFTIAEMVPSTSSSSWGNVILGLFTDLNQSYFMNLFFFCNYGKRCHWNVDLIN